MFLKPIKKWKLWTTFSITLLISIGLIIWQLNSAQAHRTLITVLLVIDFLIMTFALQMAITATFKFKAKPKKYPTKSFDFNLENCLNNLEKSGFKKKEADFGFGYMKIIGKTAYKLTFINNAEEYLKPVDEEERKKQKAETPGLNKCTKFVGFEIFLEYNDVILQRLPEFSFQGKNIYYEGFYLDKENNLLIETNVIEQDQEFKVPVSTLKKEIGIEE